MNKEVIALLEALMNKRTTLSQQRTREEAKYAEVAAWLANNKPTHERAMYMRDCLVHIGDRIEAIDDEVYFIDEAFDAVNALPLETGAK